MNFPSHAKFGLVASALTAGAQLLIKYDLKIAGFAALLAFIGSIFPDMDTDSIPSRWAARFGLLFTCCCIYTKNYYLHALIVSALFFWIKSGKHRGFTHKYSIIIFCITLGVYHSNFLYCAFVIGLLCHFILDRLSPLDSRNWV